MMMQNCPSSMRDVLLSDEMVSVDRCDCPEPNPEPKPPQSQIMTRYASVLDDQSSTVAMLNSPDKRRIGMRFFTQT